MQEDTFVKTFKQIWQLPWTLSFSVYINYHSIIIIVIVVVVVVVIMSSLTSVMYIVVFIDIVAVSIHYQQTQWNVIVRHIHMTISIERTFHQISVIHMSLIKSRTTIDWFWWFHSTKFDLMHIFDFCIYIYSFIEKLISDKTLESYNEK